MKSQWSLVAVMAAALCLPGCALFRSQQVALSAEEVTRLQAQHGPLSPATRDAWRAGASQLLGEEVKEVVDLPGDEPIVAVLGSPAAAAGKSVLEAGTDYVTANPGKVSLGGLLLVLLGAGARTLSRRRKLLARAPPAPATPAAPGGAP